MRDAFASEMTSLVSRRSEVTLLSGDIGNRMFDRFKEIAPERFMNCGIAESNMMSVAAGMALSGLRPVVYTIAPFTTTRCLEQIKVGAAYHEAPVVIVGTGSGLSYAELGPTHHSLEDIAILRALPGINILAPADSLELVAQLREAIDLQIPTYIRIGKKGEPLLHREDAILRIGRANMLREGSDVLILGIGPILSEALGAAKIISREGISVAVASMGGVKPLDTAFLEKMAARFVHWISLEEHCVTGGLGSSLLEWVSDSGRKVSVERIGVPDKFIHELGNQAYTRRNTGIDVSGIVAKIRRMSR